MDEPPDEEEQQHRDQHRSPDDDAREVLEEAGADVAATPSLGIDVSAVHRRGFHEADVVLRDLVLDELRSGRRPARSRPRG